VTVVPRSSHPPQSAFISFTTRAYYVNGRGSIPGPTLRAKPGDLVTVTLINYLDDTGADDPMLGHTNGFHSECARRTAKRTNQRS
jgi:FtsP/CotA-like multicopper oxidase with cupredoxin domain